MAINTKNGKIAVLLNILQPNSEMVYSKKGRGFIVNDFLTGNETCWQYLQKLSQEGNEYNGFQTIVMQLSGAGVDAAYYSNFVNETPRTIGTGVHGFGNSLDPNQPWPKVSYGMKRFEAVISKHKTTDSKEQLIEELFQAMSDKTLLPVDEQMRNQGNGRAFDSLRKLSSLCVEIPEAMYGSRYE